MPPNRKRGEGGCLMLEGGGGYERPAPHASSIRDRRRWPNGSNASARKVSTDCVIAPQGLFHCQAKPLRPSAPQSRLCVDSATLASTSPSRSVYPRQPSAASCGGWD